MLTSEERQRYRRHLQLPEIGEEGQARLLAARVLVVGAGGLGCPVLQYLAAAGVGTLGIADSDRVELSNLQRQVLFGNADIGELKAEAASRAIKRLNPTITCELHAGRVNRANVEKLVAAYDVVVDGSDNFATRYLLSDACVSAGRPLVSGAIYKFEGQVSVFNYQDGPTYRCLFPTPPTAAEAPNCDTTGVLGVLPGLIGCAQATEALKVVMGLGEVLRGRLWVFDALSFQTRILRFPRHPERALINLQNAPQTDYAELCAAIPTNVTAAELALLLASESPPFLLDVREPEEYYRGHLPGATLIPLTQVVARAGLLPRHHPVVVYCQRGSRSTAAIAQLQTQAGFTNLQNLEGGIEAWTREKDSTKRQYQE